MARAAWLLLSLSLLLVLFLANGYRFVGCYGDWWDRDLPERIGIDHNSVTVEECNRECTSRKYLFFGLQNSVECYCGNSYGRHRAKWNSDCNRLCYGRKDLYHSTRTFYSSEICGNEWRNTVFSTDYVSGLHYLGCYADSSNRDLSVFTKTGDMTIPKCNGICKSKGFAYFGVQNHYECFCGNSYARYGARPESECDRYCGGDHSTMCGGEWRNNVYATGLRPDRSFPPGRPIRDNMAAKLRSMSTPIPNGVVCSLPACLVAAFQLLNVNFRSDNFPVSEIDTKISQYPPAAKTKLRSLQLGPETKVTFDDSDFKIEGDLAKRSTYFGIAERVDNRIQLGMLQANIQATLVLKYLRQQHVLIRRGFNSQEIKQIEAALQSEAMRVFTDSLVNITV